MKKTENQKTPSRIICRDCGGPLIEIESLSPLFGYKIKQLQCIKCGVRITIGNIKVEVEGAKHTEVESVAIGLINEISNKLVDTKEPIEQFEEIESLHKISKLLYEGEILKVLERLMNFCKKMNLVEIESDFTVLLARFNNLEKSKRNGVIDYADYTITQNQIINAIAENLNLINKKLNTQ